MQSMDQNDTEYFLKDYLWARISNPKLKMYFSINNISPKP